VSSIFDHTKPMIAETISLSSDSFRASLMGDLYTYSAAQKSYANMSALVVQDVPIVLSSSYYDGRYRLYVEDMFFSDISGSVGSVVIYAEGFKAGVDRPVLFFIPFSTAALSYSDLLLKWSDPLLVW